MPHFLRLHTRRWLRRGQPGVFCLPAIRRFHGEAAPLLAGAGMLRLLGVQVDGRPIGCLYALRLHGRVHYYGGGFDPDWSRYSPGMLLLEQAITTAMADGDREFDFLRGTEPYKFRWGAVARVNQRLLLPFSPTGAWWAARLAALGPLWTVGTSHARAPLPHPGT